MGGPFKPYFGLSGVVSVPGFGLKVGRGFMIYPRHKGHVIVVGFSP